VTRRVWLGSILLLTVFACGPSAATTTVSTTTPLPEPTTSIAATTSTDALEPAPWADAFLAANAAPPILIDQWVRADNRSTCSMLAPEGGVEGATPRAANFAGGWAVAWDATDGPGMAADGSYCEDCGRSAVGVAGTGVGAQEAVIRSWPNVIAYADGSLVGYGAEGSIGAEIVVDDPFTSSADSPTQLAYIAIAPNDCLYNVWSRRSESELLDVIDRLRFVEAP